MRFPIAPVALTVTLLLPSVLAASADAATPQARSCSARAARYAEAERPAFLARCRRGARAPHGHTGATAQSAPAKAVVQPSGVRPAERSQACTAEADRRGLHDAALQAFRDHCLAGAAPVGATGSRTQSDKPTRSRTDIGEKDTAHPR